MFLLLTWDLVVRSHVRSAKRSWVRSPCPQARRPNLTGPLNNVSTKSPVNNAACSQIDPLLLLKAALILQACQRCPLVLAGCILFRGRWAGIFTFNITCISESLVGKSNWRSRIRRVVSTQMPPCLTVRVMAHETQTYNKVCVRLLTWKSLVSFVLSGQHNSIGHNIIDLLNIIWSKSHYFINFLFLFI